MREHSPASSQFPRVTIRVNTACFLNIRYRERTVALSVSPLVALD